MACFHPLPAFRAPNGVVSLKEPVSRVDGTVRLLLPCGGCIGCRTTRAREWALRCTLELASHEVACWTTLTYADEYLPPSLRKDHLQGFLKRLRESHRRSGAASVRFFASGEYGERTFRPHYHAILYGVPRTSLAVQAAWPHGYARVDPLSGAAISYVAGYCSKKVGWRDFERGERVDYETGESYRYQPPFIQMSRRPGIGGAARRFVNSWRDTAIFAGARIPVPRFLNKAWLDQATDEERELLTQEKLEKASRKAFGDSRSMREIAAAAEAAAVARHSLTSQGRVKL